MESKKLISFQEYLELIAGHEDGHLYIDSFHIYEGRKSFGLAEYLYEGMLKWPDDDYPERWAGPYPLNYVKIAIIKTTTNETEVDVFNKRKNYVKYSTHHRSQSVMNRVGFGNDYWVRPFMDQLCTFSTMSEEELKIVEDAETPEEHLFHELRALRTLNSIDMLPKNEYTVEHPYRLYLKGNDDCSYSMYYMPEIENEILSMEAYLTLAISSWFIVNTHCHFTN